MFVAALDLTLNSNINTHGSCHQMGCHHSAFKGTWGSTVLGLKLPVSYNVTVRRETHTQRFLELGEAISGTLVFFRFYLCCFPLANSSFRQFLSFNLYLQNTGQHQEKIKNRKQHLALVEYSHIHNTTHTYKHTITLQHTCGQPPKNNVLITINSGPDVVLGPQN